MLNAFKRYDFEITLWKFKVFHGEEGKKGSLRYERKLFNRVVGKNILVLFDRLNLFSPNLTFSKEYPILRFFKALQDLLSVMEQKPWKLIYLISQKKKTKESFRNFWRKKALSTKFGYTLQDPGIIIKPGFMAQNAKTSLWALCG